MKTTQKSTDHKGKDTNIKIRSLFLTKYVIRYLKSQTTEWEKIYAMNITIKVSYTEYLKIFYKSIKKKTKTNLQPARKLGKDFFRCIVFSRIPKASMNSREVLNLMSN